MLDPGAPGNERIVEGAPKLVRIDLATDEVTKVIAGPGDVALQGHLPQRHPLLTYITDSGARGAIIVVDLETGTSFRALDGHPSTQYEDDVVVAIDGQPLRRPDGDCGSKAVEQLALAAVPLEHRQPYLHRWAIHRKVVYRDPWTRKSHAAQECWSARRTWTSAEILSQFSNTEEMNSALRRYSHAESKCAPCRSRS